MIRTLAIFTALLLTASIYAQDIFGNSSAAYMVMPAETISGGIASRQAISLSGKWIVFQRKSISKPEDIQAGKENGVIEWFAYERRTKLSRKLNVPAGTTDVSVLGDDQNAAYALGDSNSSSIGFVSLLTGQSKPVNLGGAQISYDGQFAFAPFLMAVEKNNDAKVIYPNGKVEVFIPPSGVKVYAPLKADQYTISFYCKNSNNQTGLLTVNKGSGKTTYANLTREEHMELLGRDPESAPFIVYEQKDAAYIGVRTKPGADRLKNPLIPEQARLAAGDTRVELSQTQDFVIYKDAGALLLREIKPMDVKLAQTLTEEDLKKELLNRGKQIGTAFAIFAGDNDGMMPGLEGWEAKLKPYIKNNAVMRDFNYTFRGGNGNVNNANTVEMGFIPGPGGRVVVYMDSSAKWIPNP